jgi:Zn-dependent protease
MLISVFAYSFVFGWNYAFGFVALLLVHEMGHYLAAKKRNLKVGLPTFVPFVGAWIQLKEQPMDAETEAFVGIAGPMLGSGASFVCYLLALDTGSHLLLALAYASFILNIFNLIPVSPLDGGRIVSVISPRIWFLGFPILIALFVWKPNPLLILIAVFAAPQLWTAFKDKNVLSPEYYRASGHIRLRYAAQYLLLASLLAVMAYESYDLLGVKTAY